MGSKNIQQNIGDQSAPKKNSSLTVVIIVLSVLLFPVLLCGGVSIYSFVMVKQRADINQLGDPGTPCLMKDGKVGFLNPETNACEPRK